MIHVTSEKNNRKTNPCIKNSKQPIFLSGAEPVEKHMTVNVPLAVVGVVFAIGMVVIILVLLRRITFKSKTAVTASDFKS